MRNLSESLAAALMAILTWICADILGHLWWRSRLNEETATFAALLAVGLVVVMLFLANGLSQRARRVFLVAILLLWVLGWAFALTSTVTINIDSYFFPPDTFARASRQLLNGGIAGYAIVCVLEDLRPSRNRSDDGVGARTPP